MTSENHSQQHHLSYVDQSTSNLFEGLSAELTDEIVTILAQSLHIRIEQIVSYGNTSPEQFWYDQDEQEWVVVLRGEAKLLFENREPLHMKPGDHVLIPAHQKHRVEWTTQQEPTVWLAVFYRD